MQWTRRLLDEHGVAKGEHAVAQVDGLMIGAHDLVAAGKGAHQHHEGGAGHVEVGDQASTTWKVEPGMR